jgi:hypothetical protein
MSAGGAIGTGGVMGAGGVSSTGGVSSGGIARTLRRHHDLILNWFRAKKEISSGAVEGLNTNAKLAIRKARGFRTYGAIETALYHQLGRLPEPAFLTHRFC